jgi:hypothetical protein
MRAIYFALFVTILCSCKKEELQKGEDNLFYVEFQIGNDTIYYEDGEENYGNGPGIRTYEDSLGRLHSQYTVFQRSAQTPDYTRNVLGIQVVKFLTDTLFPSYNVSYSLFDEGTYGYGSYNLDSTTAGIDGAIFLYVDNDSVTWSSDVQYGTQESWANFEITSHKAVDEMQFGAKTKGTFNCRVFNDSGGHLDLRNGRFHARTIYPQ